MLSLLGLPREIRDKIIDEVVATRIAHPADTTRICRNFRSQLYDDSTSEESQPVSLASYTSPSRSIFMVNKQLRCEDMDSIDRNDLVTTVHLAFIDEEWVWPSWTFIFPRFKTIIDRLDVELLFALSDDSAGQGLVPNTPFAPLGFLNRVLVLGPSPIHKPPATDRKIHVQELRINVNLEHPGPLYSEEEIPVRNERYSRLYPHYGIFTQIYLRELAKHVEELSAQVPSQVPPLISRVQRIVLCSNGKIQYTHDSPSPREQTTIIQGRSRRYLSRCIDTLFSSKKFAKINRKFHASN